MGYCSFATANRQQHAHAYTTNLTSKQHGINMSEEDVPTLMSTDKPAKPLGMRKNGTAPMRPPAPGLRTDRRCRQAMAFA